MNNDFVRFESKRIKFEFDALLKELDLPDPNAPAPRRESLPIDLSAPLTPSPRLAASMGVLGEADFR